MYHGFWMFYSKFCLISSHLWLKVAEYIGFLVSYNFLVASLHGIVKSSPVIFPGLLFGYWLLFYLKMNSFVKQIICIMVLKYGMERSPKSIIISSFLWIIWEVSYFSKHTCMYTHERDLLVILSILWLGLRVPGTTLKCSQLKMWDLNTSWSVFLLGSSLF